MRPRASLLRTSTRALPLPTWRTRRRQRVVALALHALLIVLAAVFLFPLLYLFSRSLMRPPEIYTLPPRLWPATPDWSNYAVAWSRAPFLRYLANTMTIVSLQVIGVTASAALCGFGFARLEFPGRKLLFAVVLSTLMLPSTVTLIPLYIVFHRLGWLNTYLPLVVPAFFGGGAFNIFLFRQFFQTLPRELDEAAVLDGATTWQIFTQIVLPLSKSAIAVVATLTFMAGWTDIFGPAIFLNDSSKWTLAQGVHSLFLEFQGLPQVQYVAAMSIVLVIPPLLLYACVQRYLIEGIVMTGLKG